MVTEQLCKTASPNARLGVALAPSRHLPLPEVVRLAQLAEELGYESIWVPETWGADAVSVLAVLTRETQSLRLAAGVFNVFSRSAALLAQTAATLQQLSAGRFILGLGTSGPKVVESWHGMPFARPLQRTAECVAVIRMALSGERVYHSGAILQLQGFTLLDPPSQPVPIYIAALGPRNVYLTGQIADGWLPIFVARGHFTPFLAQLATGARAAGRDPAAIDVASFIPAVLGERSGLLLRQQLAYYVGGMGTFYHTFVSELGFAAEADRIRELWLNGEHRTAARSVDDSLLEAFTLGPEGEAARIRLDELREQGIKLPILAPPHGSSAAEIEATLRALAPEPYPIMRA